MDFIITGLPRSRTAWLAAWLTNGDIHCHHEPLAKYSVGMIPEPNVYNGIADTGAMFFVDELKLAYPNAKWVIIDRDPIESLNSTVEALGGEAIRDMMRLQIDNAQRELDKIENCMLVEFHTMDLCLEEIWEYCIGGGYSIDRANLYKQMRITDKRYTQRMN